jgi:O-antigen/teichoic acid export membrane protein
VVNKEIGKRFILFGLANVIAAAIPFLLTPFLTRALSPEEYGYISLFEAVIQLLAPLIIFGGDGFYSSNYFKGTKQRAKELQFNLLLLPLTLSSFLFLAIFITYLFAEAGSIYGSNFILLLAPAVFFQSICALMYSKLQMEGSAGIYLGVKVSGPIVGGLITVWLIYFENWSADGRLLGIVVAFAFSALWCLVIHIQEDIFKLKASLELIKKAMSFGKGMIVHSWSGVLFFASDRVILGYMSGVQDLGAYAVALQFGLVMAIVQTTFSQIWTPFMLKKLESECCSADILKYEIIAMTLLSILGGVIALLIKPFYFLLIGEDFHYAQDVAYWVVASYFMLGLYKVFTVYFFYSQNTRTLAKITFSVALFNVMLTIVLIKVFGLTGAAIATFISSVIFFFAVYFKTKSIKLKRVSSYA